MIWEMGDEEIKVGDGRWVKSLGELLNGIKTCIFGAHFDSDDHFPPDLQYTLTAIY